MSKREKKINKTLLRIEAYLKNETNNNDKVLAKKKLLEDELFNAKESETHGAFVGGWLNTTLEKDKSILTLSAAGIGVLVTFSNSINTNDLVLFFNYIFALMFFVIAVITSIYIFGINAKYLMKVIHKKPTKSIVCYDYLLSFSFIMGLLLTISLAFLLISENTNTNTNTINIKNLESKYIELLKRKINKIERSNEVKEKSNESNLRSKAQKETYKSSVPIKMQDRTHNDAGGLFPPKDKDKKGK